MKIAFIGAPGTGKTTVAEDVKNKLKYMGYDTESVSEYARTYIRRFGPPKSVAEQIVITQNQITSEARLEKIHDIIVCDSCSLLGYIYGATLAYHHNSKDRGHLNLLHELVIEHFHTYDVIFYIPKDREMVDDSIRYQTNEEADRIDKAIEGLLLLHADTFYEITGNREERVDDVIETLIEKGLLASGE